MKLFKNEKMEKKKLLVVFHGFDEDDKLINLISSQDGMEVVYPNLLDFFGDSENKMDVWIRNCRNYLGDLSKQYDEMTLLGYSLGGVFAGNCATLPFIKKIILIDPATGYLEYQGERKTLYSEQIENASRKIGVSSSLLSIIYAKLVGSFENCLKQSNSKILILQEHGEYSIEEKKISHLFRYLDKKKTKLIKLRSDNKGLLNDSETSEYVALLVNYFMEKKDEEKGE